MMVMVWVSLAARVAAIVGGCVRRRWRFLLVLIAVALLVLPLMRGGVGAMLVRRLLFWCMRRTLRR